MTSSSVQRSRNGFRFAERFGWLGDGDAASFVSIVEPLDAPAAGTRSAGERRAPVVIVGGYGIEALGADRTLRELGLQLAAQGRVVLHVEAPDVGDGAGHQRHCNRLQRWVDAVQRAIVDAAGASGTRAIVIGMRMGGLVATLAATRASSSEHVSALALWAPVVKGRLATREMKLAASSSAEPEAPAGSTFPRTSEPGDLGVGGFVLPESMAAELASVDLTTLRPCGSAVLIIDRDDVGAAASLVTAWRERGIDVDAPAVPGFAAAVVDDPERGHIATEVNAAIARWCDARTDVPVDRDVVDAQLGDVTLRDHLTVVADHTDRTLPPAASVEESVELIGRGHAHLAIVTRPSASHALTGPAIVICSTGSNARSGPGRIATTMARRWAARGATVVRVDRPGIGGSGHRDAIDPTTGYAIGDSYHEDSIDEAVDVLRWVRAAGHDRVVIVGMCSGAWTGYRLLERDLPTDAAQPIGLISINQVMWDDVSWGGDGETGAIAAKAGRELRKGMVDPERWKELLRGEIPVRDNAVRLLRLAGIHAKRLATRGANPFTRQLDTIAAKGRWQVQYFNSDELGPSYLELQAPRKIAELTSRGLLTRHDFVNAGHTFSPQLAKDWLLASIDAELERRGVLAGTTASAAPCASR